MKQCARFAIVASLESRRALTRATTLVTAPPAPGIFVAERSIALPSIPRIMSVKQEMADVTISVSALSRHAAISGMPSASTIKSRLRGSTQQLLRPPIPNATYNATRRRRYHGDHEYERWESHLAQRDRFEPAWYSFRSAHRGIDQARRSTAVDARS